MDRTGTKERGTLSGSSLESWLKSLGFSRGDPFAHIEADQERVLLPEFFVDIDSYEQIKEDKSIIVFAPRGGGKSALRVVLANSIAPFEIKSQKIAVEFTDFDVLISKQQNGQIITIDDYMTLLLRASSIALWELIGGTPIKLGTDRHHICRERAKAISMPVRIRLSNTIKVYHPSLLAPDHLFECFQSLQPSNKLDWHLFNQAACNRCLNTNFLAKIPDVDPIVNLLADINDADPITTNAFITPTEKLAEFSRLCQRLGLQSAHFLIDRLDENIQMVDNPHAQVAILEPLLAHLPILEMPNIAFKFFLTRKTRDLLINRPTIRRDRLTDRSIVIKWQVEHLKNLLCRRLEVYSDGTVHDLSGLFVSNSRNPTADGPKQQDFDVGQAIESEMLQLAQGSPRRLLLAAQLLFRRHIQRVGPKGLLEHEDWLQAKKELMQRDPPLLRLDRNSPVVWVGAYEKRLTSREHAILLSLVDHNGKCSRDELIKDVWEAEQGVSNQAIDQAVSRLREKLGEYSDTPTYLITERSKGFVLHNYELE
jgi:hypothetical protein